MALLDLLADDLLGSLETDDTPRRVLLWLDPERGFARLADYLDDPLAARGAHLLRCDADVAEGQLAAKLALLRLEGEPAARAVVYLPGFGRGALEPRPDGAAPALWSVYDYRYKGAVWGRGAGAEVGALPAPPTLLRWLREHDLKVADDRAAQALTAGGGDSLLARFAAARRAETPAAWPRPLRVDDVRAALGGDPREALRALLAAPAAALAEWADPPLVFDRLTDHYGLQPPTGDADPEALADAFALQLALAEAWSALGRAADFPFLARLPEDLARRQRQCEFVHHDVLRHADLAPRFRVRVGRLEPAHDVTGWAAGRPGQPAALPGLARARWQAFVDRLAAAEAGGWKAARDFLVAENEAVTRGAATFPDRDAGDVGWATLADLVRLAEAASEACAALGAVQEAARLVADYAERGWQVDWLHLQARAGCALGSGLEVARRVADAVYFDYAAAAAERFAALVEREGVWPPEGTVGVESLRPALWSAEGARAAVVIVDALRWDLARQLQARLSAGEATLTPVLATLPTETPFGMTALLPLGAAPLAVEWGSGGIGLRQDGGPDLGTRDGRKAFLAGALRDASGKTRVGCMDLEALLQGATVPEVPLVVVFDNAIDEQGHKGTAAFPGLAAGFVAGLARGVERLHAAGLSTVHLVTDHGFLLLPPEAVDGLGRPAVPAAQAAHKDDRWAALKPDAPTAEVLRLPLPLAPTAAVLGFPRGVRTLTKAAPYLHGGLSLQECVLPHLVSRRALPALRVGLDLAVTTPQLTGGLVAVALRPAIPAGQLPLGGLQPLRAVLWVETAAEGDAPPRAVSERVEVLLPPDGGERKQALFFADAAALQRQGVRLHAGQILWLRAEDVESGRDLGRLALTLLVDWD